VTGQIQNELLIGAHFSISGGLHKALYEADSLDCNALQIFTKNAAIWKERILTQKDIHQFLKAKKETGISEIISHASYLINIAGPDPDKAAMSCNALKQEFHRCHQLEIPYIVLHPGSHMGKGESEGIQKIASNINLIFKLTKNNTVRLLLETTAGQGSSIGHKFEQLADIVELVHDKNRIGVCLDTCHIFAAGYDISTGKGYQDVMNKLDAIIGLDNLFAIHLNDSKKESSSRVDRHENIGKGFIGNDGFKYIINDHRLKHIPKIIETPKTGPLANNKKGGDEFNLNLLRNFQYK